MKKEKQNKNNKGFTLIELLVVVLIIGILAAIALPQYKMAVAKSQYAKLMDISKAIASAQDRYFMVHGTHTNNFNDLDIEMPQNYISKTTKEYCYDWGGCSIRWRDALICGDYKTNAHLVIYLRDNEQYSEVKKGRIFCTTNSSDTEDFAHKVCQQVTGQTSPNGNEEHVLCGTTYIGTRYLFSSF